MDDTGATNMMIFGDQANTVGVSPTHPGWIGIEPIQLADGNYRDYTKCILSVRWLAPNFEPLTEWIPVPVAVDYTQVESPHMCALAGQSLRVALFQATAPSLSEMPDGGDPTQIYYSPLYLGTYKTGCMSMVPSGPSYGLLS
jgi:hypothetical protein